MYNKRSIKNNRRSIKNNRRSIKNKRRSIKKKFKGGAAAPSKKKEWVCPQCTFANKIENPFCEMCGFEKPTVLDNPGSVLFDVDYAKKIRGIGGFAEKVYDLSAYEGVPPNRLGLLKIEGNSCWFDSAVFALLIARSPVLHNALLINPIVPFVKKTLNFRGIKFKKDGTPLTEIEKDEYIDLARKTMRFFLIQIQKHIFFCSGKILQCKNPIRMVLGSIGLSDASFDWGKEIQCDSEEFIFKLMELLPVKMEERLQVIKIEGISNNIEYLEEPHNDLVERERVRGISIRDYIRSGKRIAIDNDFKYVSKNITEYSGGGIIIDILRNYLEYNGYNAKRFGKTTINLSDLIFKRILFNDKKEFYDTEYCDDNLVKIKTKYGSLQRIVKCPSGIMMIKLHRNSDDPTKNESFQTPVYPDETITPNFNSFFREGMLPEGLFDLALLGIPDDPLHLTCIITRVGGARYGHYTVYFKFDGIFYFYNDIGPSIKIVGDYKNLIADLDVITNGLFFIYKK